MHIVDGALAAPVLVTGGLIATAGIALGLRRLDGDRIPQVGLLTACFFVASLVHVPVGPSSVHLILGGLMGIILGWAVFPAMFVGLLLQAVFFGFGGLTVLGVNAANIAVPAVVMGLTLRPWLCSGNEARAILAGVIAGAGAVALTCLLVGLSLALSGEAFLPAAKLVFISHVPLMAVEGFVTGAIVALVRKVKPEMLAGVARAAA